MKTNSELLQKYRSTNQETQHLYDKQNGLSLWTCSEDYRKQYLKNHPVMIVREIPNGQISNLNK